MISPPLSFTLFTDGGARGNPGPAATGFVIYDSTGSLLYQGGHYLGEATNNTAEYQAVFQALTYLATQLHAPSLSVIHLNLDSKLVCEQLSGRFKVKQPHLVSLAHSIHALLDKYQFQVTYRYIPRTQNSVADTEVNRVLDRHQSHYIC